MSGKKESEGKFRLVDLLVILLCLSGAAYSINLFWADLFQTLNGQNKTPVGTVSIKRNIVQRRMSDRVIWDRLIRESPVYSNEQNSRRNRLHKKKYRSTPHVGQGNMGQAD